MRTIVVWIGAVMIVGGLWGASVITQGLADEPAAPSSSSGVTEGATGTETSGSKAVPPAVEGDSALPPEVGQTQERTVLLTQPVHFTDANGQDVVVGPGSYRLGAESIDRIRLVPTEKGESVVIGAVNFTHQQTVESPVPVTVPDPEQPDVLHLALVFPSGMGLEAIGTYSGVKPRAVAKTAIVVQAMQLAPTRTMQIAATVAAPPSVVIFEHPNFGGRSQTLGVGGYVFSELNDRASSIRVPAGLVAVLYEQVDAGGGYGLSVDLLEDRPDLSQVNFNDKLSYVCIFSSPNSQGFIWARASVQNGQFVAGHWERQRASGAPVNTVAVVAPVLAPHPSDAPPASCSGGVIVRDHRGQPLPPNDVANDTDGDGLGNQLEAALGTCASKTSSVAGVNCNAIADPRDTDGDGLQDGWEVLGKWATNSQNKPVFLDLPKWGADPRHKDIFIEVDFRRLDLAENQQGVALHMPPDAARQMAAVYADAATVDPVLRTAHAVSVANPDGLPGIRLHLDTGVPPERPEDATIYGDWGGYNPVDALPTGPQRPEQVWQTQMDRSRHGVFHYVMGYPTGGGSCGQGIACGFNMNSVYVAAHEFGHTLGLDHNGPYRVENEPNCKPQYISLMSYAYGGAAYTQFSDGRRTSLQMNNHFLQETNAINPADRTLLDALASVFNYKVDPLAGHVDWNRDGSFSPANARVRAYANYKPGGGGCEFTRQGEQDSGIQSLRSPAVVRYKNQLWMFAVHLNGHLAYSYTSAWNCSPNVDNCPVPKFVQPGIREIGPISAIDAKTFTVNGVEMIIIVGIRPDGTMFYTWVTVTSTGLNVWDSVITIDGSSPAAGEPSLANTRNKTSLSLAYKGTDNVVRTRRFTGNSWSAEQVVTVGGQPLAVHPNTSPALAFVYLPLGVVAGQEHLVGAFTDPQGYIQLYSPQFPGPRWERLPIPYDSMHSPVGRPVMAWTSGPGDGGVRTTSGATAAAPTLSRGLSEEGEQGQAPQEETPAGEIQERAVGRKLPLDVTALPSLEMAPVVSTGRFYILFLEYQVPPPGYPATNAIRMAMSYAGPDGKLRIGLNSYFDNVWAYAYGLSLVTPSEAALRAAVTYSIHKPWAENHVFFRPHADGMTDLTYNDYDDWKTLGWGSCATLAPTQTSARVNCAPAW